MDFCGAAATCVFRRGELGSDLVEACTALGGTGQGAVACSFYTSPSMFGSFPGVGMCDEELNHGVTPRYAARTIGNVCCGSTMSNVCSGPDEGPDPNLCQNAASFLGDRIHSITCMGLTEAECQQLGGEFEEAGAGGGCDSCSDVMSTVGETAQSLCAGLGGTARSITTCNAWTEGATEHVGRFDNMTVRCGGFVGGESINEHLFAAGDACCSDQTPVCRGEDVHEVSGAMTLDLTSVAGLSDGDRLSDAAEGALKNAIAAQIEGVDAQDVGNITVVVKVKGRAPMQVADAAAFVASAEAKQAVEAGLAAQANVNVTRVTATLSVGGAGAAGNTSEETTTANTTERRLQETVNVEYEIQADLSDSDGLTSRLQSADASADLTAAINTELAEAEGDFDVTVDEISADSEVTISYQIRTTDPEAATAAAEALTAAATDETSQTALMTGLNTELAAAGVDVQVNSMTVAQPTVVVEDTGDAAPATTARPASSNGAFRFGPGGLLIVAAVVFQQAQF